MKNVILVLIVLVLGFIMVDRVTNTLKSEPVKIIKTDSPKVVPEVLALLGLGLILMYVTNNPRKRD